MADHGVGGADFDFGECAEVEDHAGGVGLAMPMMTMGLVTKCREKAPRKSPPVTSRLELRVTATLRSNLAADGARRWRRRGGRKGTVSVFPLRAMRGAGGDEERRRAVGGDVFVVEEVAGDEE